MKHIFRYLMLLIVLGFLGLSVSVCTNLKDRNSGYSADVSISGGEPAVLSAGFAAVPVTPEVPDRWIDKNGDASYNPKDGDSFTDGNGNGIFDPVWIAGFGHRRAANGIHDDLWARCMVLDDGKTRLAIVALDAIGFMNDEVIDVKKRISAGAGITYTVIASTHTHEGPDLLGLWGKSFLKSGVSAEYKEFVKGRIVKAIEYAAENIRPEIGRASCRERV